MILTFLTTTNYIQYLNKLNGVFQDLERQGIISNIYGAFRTLVILIIFGIMIKAIIKALASGGQEPIEPYKHIFIPLFYILITYHWVNIMGLIGDLGHVIEQVINDSITKGNITASKTFDAKINEMIDKVLDKNVIDNTINIISGGVILEYASVGFLKLFAGLGNWIEKFSLFAFWSFAKITLLILKVTGIIALGLTFTGHFDSFKTWFKSYISVSFWVPIAYLIFYILDKLYLVWVNNWQSDNPTQNFYQVGLFIGGYFIFGLMKLVFMFKIPNLVSMVIGSGGGSGGIFASVFTPVKMTTKATTGLAKGVTGGI